MTTTRQSASAPASSSPSHDEGRRRSAAGPLTIGALARATGVKVETIRWYEKVGVLRAAGRTGGNYRTYQEEDVRRLTFVRRARELGFPLDRVRTLLELSGERTRSCGEIDETAEDQLREVDRRITELQALRRELAAVIASCPGGAIADCRIIQTLGRRRNQTSEGGGADVG